MANKRDFKKYTDAVGAMLVEEMLYAYSTIEKADKEAISAAVGQVLQAVEDARHHSNIYFDRGQKSFDDNKQYAAEKHRFFKALFNKVENEFNASVDEAIKKFNSAIPEEVKKALKESAN